MGPERAGTQPARRMRPERPPTANEVRAHRVSHLPIRDRCDERVAGRGRDWPHRSKTCHENLAMPEVLMDSWFGWEAAGEEQFVVFVGRDRETKFDFARIVPVKGGGVKWVSEQIVLDLRKIGIHGDIVFRAEQEPALMESVHQVCKLRPSSKSCRKHPGVAVEGGRVRGTSCVSARRHDSGAQDAPKKGGQYMPCAHLVIAWLAEHSVGALNRYQMGSDGTTPSQRLNARKFARGILELMQRRHVSGVVEGTSGLDVAEAALRSAFGKRKPTEEHLVMTEDGLVVGCRAARGIAAEELEEPQPRRMRTPRVVVEKYGGSSVPRMEVGAELRVRFSCRRKSPSLLSGRLH